MNDIVTHGSEENYDMTGAKHTFITHLCKLQFKKLCHKQLDF